MYLRNLRSPHGRPRPAKVARARRSVPLLRPCPQRPILPRLDAPGSGAEEGGTVNPETVVFHRAISAIDDIIMAIPDGAALSDVLARVRLHLEARIEQSKPAGDWLDD